MKNIHEEFYSGNIAAVEDILTSDPTSVNCKDEDGKTILHLVSSEGNTHLVAVIISLMHSQLQPRDNYGRTPLDLAHENENYEVISQLGFEIFRREVIIYKSIPAPSDQRWIIKRLLLRGFKTSEKGMCWGIGRMARQAHFADDMDKLINRQKELDISQSAESFNAKLNTLEEEKDGIIQVLEGSSISDENLELKVRLAEIREYLNDVDAFFSGISLYHNPEKYAGEYNGSGDGVFLFSSSDNVHQKKNPASFWLTPKLLDGNAIVDLKNYDLVFASTISIKNFLNLLDRNLSAYTFSVSLEHDHNIEISYSPQKKWFFTNGNHLPTMPFNCLEKLAITIHYAMEIQVKPQNSPHVFCRATISSLESSKIEILTKLHVMERCSDWKYYQHHFIDFAYRSKLEKLTNSGIVLKEILNLDNAHLMICIKHYDVFCRLVKHNLILYSDINKTSPNDFEFILTNEDLFFYFKKKPILFGVDATYIVKFLKQMECSVSPTLIPDNILFYLIDNDDAINFLKYKNFIFKFLCFDGVLQNKILDNLDGLLKILSTEDIHAKLLPRKEAFIATFLDNFDKLKDFTSQQIDDILENPTIENIMDTYRSNTTYQTMSY
ncbi:MAG: ankyrin repeat domain-containing protein [Legionellaceae bacterium]|nr:ankyrin repeat domain-containing protein [Legionellaceae bacterium]